jgi:polyketide synthase PksN
VIQEYIATADVALCEPATTPSIIVLSAKDEARLQERVQQLSAALDRGAFGETDLASIAYTLQVGREPLENRLAFLASSVQEMQVLLRRIAAGETAIENVFRGDVRNSREALSLFTTDGALQDAVSVWIARGQFAKVLELWIKGMAFDWNRLYGTARPRRVSLPAYPFARERYWLPNMEGKGGSDSDSDGGSGPDSPPPPAPPVIGPNVVLLKPRWKADSASDDRAAAKPFAQRWVAVCEEPGQRFGEYEPEVARAIAGVNYVRLNCTANRVAERYEQFGLKLLDLVQRILGARPRNEVLLQVVVDHVESEERSVLLGLGALLKTAQIENPKLAIQLIGIEGTQSAATLVRTLESNASRPDQAQVLYRGGVRSTAGFEAVESIPQVARPWRRGDVYLITGGAGGLGLLFAREILEQQPDVTLILTGRSAPGETQRQQLQSLGAGVRYLQMDVADAAAVARALQDVRRTHGRLDGVIHSAGVLRDSFLLKKNATEVREVFAAKVAGTVNLDEATREDPLQFFVVFSSVAGAFGNMGQGDYAMANAFMDEYVRCRARATQGGWRAGRSLSINWPLWADGGMQLDAAHLAQMRALGAETLATRHGLEAFYQAFGTQEAQMVVLAKGGEALHATTVVQPAVAAVSSTDSAAELRTLQHKTLQQLTRLFAEVSGMPPSRIDAREPLSSYGIDSVMVMRLNEKLATRFAQLPRTLFFEHAGLREIADYLVREHRNECAQWSGLQENAPASVPTQSQQPQIVAEPARQFNGETFTVSNTDSTSSSAAPRPDDHEPIAIIGLSGRYPQARTLQKYWEILEAGRDCITEIPQDRWDLDGFYCPDVQQAVSQGRSYCKWGGFIDGFSEFDPLFFNMSPREAEGIDPQERLFLQSCWEVLEDAGYTRATLATRHQGRVGVFAGITKTGFELYGPELWQRGESGFPRTSFSSLANRVSYFLNLHGPSMPIDTMCSASLTAIHEACEHLRRDECELAIAGGVNLYLHPSSYVAMCGVEMLSATGRCRSFGAAADGMVPGEGVGAVLLKRLSRAIEDGDVIHALVRGTSINHGGKTNGYTVPNPQAQGELIRTALQKAGVNARTVSYLEAHGTGTSLGDPIEIAGLTQAFGQDTKDTQYCAIGSAKSNIGHLEAAAGMAGLTKVLLQMKHHMLAPTLHVGGLNDNISFERTPFKVQRYLTSWQRPVVTIDGETKEYPRIAGLSSFGAGGSNAHIVLEEFCEPEDSRVFTFSVARPAIIVLSAKDEARLRERAQQLLECLDIEFFCDDSLADIAYTLQVGRETMEHRLALPVVSVMDLSDKLYAYLHGTLAAGDFHQGDIRRDRQALAAFNADEDTAGLIDVWIQKGKYDRLMELWVNGLSFDWQRLYGQYQPQRISLPTYPFAREEYWFAPRDRSRGAQVVKVRAGAAAIHPLLHENVSQLGEQRYRSMFTAEDGVTTESGSRVLPDALLLEMARAAMEHGAGLKLGEEDGIRIQNLVWSQPVEFGAGGATVFAGLYEHEDGQGRTTVCFEIYSEIEFDSRGSRVVHLQGTAEGVSIGAGVMLDLEDVADRADGECVLLARQTSRPVTSSASDGYVVLAAVIETALQDAGAPLRAMSELDILATAPANGWVCVEATRGSAEPDKNFDIQFCDDDGRVWVRLRSQSAEAQDQAVLLKSDWHVSEPVPASTPTGTPTAIERWVVFVGGGEEWSQLHATWSAQVERRFPGVRCVALAPPSGGLELRFTEYAVALLGCIQQVLGNGSTQPVLLQLVIGGAERDELDVLRGLGALLKTAQMENPKFVGQVIEMEGTQPAQTLVERLEADASRPEEREIRYQGGQRWVVALQEVE